MWYKDDGVRKSQTRQPWQITRKEWLGKPIITKPSNGADLVPSTTLSNENVPSEPFLNRYTIKRGPISSYQFTGKDCTSYPMYTVFDGDKAIASYDGSHLVVSKPYRRQGIATELVKDYRTRNIDIPVADTRTPASQKVQQKAHEQIVMDALNRGEPVPDEVRKDYL